MSEEEDQINVFQNITSELEKIEESLKSLLLLASCMKQSAPGVFDEEDFQIVEQKIKKYEQEKQNIESDLSQKVELYNKTIRTKEKILQQRIHILESIDNETNVFTHHPDLMENFVCKQAELSKLLQQMKSKFVTE